MSLFFHKSRPNIYPDGRLVLDPLRGRGKSIDGDLNVHEEGSEQNERNLAITTRLR
jgi:hypothetical protein